MSSLPPKEPLPVLDVEILDNLKGIYAVARRCLSGDGRLSPITFFETPGGTIPVMTPGGGPDEGILLASLVKKLNASSVILIREAWACKMDKDEKITTAPSKHPKRYEIVMINLYVRGLPGCFLSTTPISRDEQGVPSLPETMSEPEYCPVTGNIGDTFTLEVEWH